MICQPCGTKQFAKKKKKKSFAHNTRLSWEFGKKRLQTGGHDWCKEREREITHVVGSCGIPPALTKEC